MEAIAIQRLAFKCQASFKHHLQRIEELKEEISEEASCLEEQGARFNLWAANNGVFALGNASLDSRLRGHEDLATIIRDQLLYILNRLSKLASSRTCTSSLSGIHAAQRLYDDKDSDDDEIEETCFADDNYLYTSSTPSECSSASQTGVTTPSSWVKSEKDEETNEPSPVVGVIHAIHRLHRVGTAIRRSGATSHDLKASVEQFLDEDGRDVVNVFEEWCLTLLNFKWGEGADPNTLQRIAHANAERRRKFLYGIKHQKKLMGPKQVLPASKTRLESMSKINPGSQPSSTIESISGPDKQKTGPLSTTQRSNMQLSQTTASKVVKDSYIYEPTIRSTMTSAAPSTQLLIDSSIYPPAPKVPAGSAEFFCPYCCRVHPAIERSGKRWKHHFLKDLSPYICLVENCSEPYKLYPDQHSWVKHMESHNMRYKCSQHSKAIHFNNEAEYDAHIISQHQKLSRSRLERLRSFNNSSTRLEICNCPICGFTPTTATNPGQSVAKNDAAYKELITHIANDLHFIALWSLGANENAEGSVSSKASDHRIAEDSNSQASDLAFMNFDRDVQEEKGEMWFDEPPEQFIEVVAIVPEGANPEHEWLFHMLTKKPYEGPETDPKLANFVRRFRLDIFLQEGETADPIIPCHVLPTNTPSKRFYGRQGKLRQLESHLHPTVANKNLQTITITGPAGIGKTELAQQFCKNHQNQFDVILWVRVDAESKLANDFVRIAIELGFVGKYSAESRDQGHCRQLVKAWLANPRKDIKDQNSETASWLMVLDHIIDPDLVNEAWPPNCQSGSILMTSRKEMPWNLANYPVLPVGPFDPEDSAAFLSSLIKNDDIGAGALRLGSTAQHSPDQLIFLANMIDSNRYSLEKFIQASRDENGKNVILILHTQDATENQTQFSEWALQSLSPKAAALLDVMAILDPDQITERMLTMPPDNISIPDYPKTPNEYHDARNELFAVSFISKDRSTNRLNIHRLIQDAARKLMSDEYFRDVFNTSIALINDEWPYQSFTWRHEISRWPKCEELYSHIVRLQHFSERVPPTKDDIDEAYGFARLTTDVLWYCHERGRFIESEVFYNTALDRCHKLRELLQEDPSLSRILNVAQIDNTIAETHHNRGCVSSEMNRPQEALEHQLMFNKMLLGELAVDPKTDMRLSMSFNQLGVAYMINNDWKKGEECFRRSIVEMEIVQDFRRYKISHPLVNLAYCHSLNERYDEAEPLLREGLASQIEEFGENDTESFITGRFYHGLANIKFGQGKEQEGLDFLKKAREHYRLTLGRGHHRSADVTAAIGRHYARVGDDKTAVEWFNKALHAYGDRSMYNPERTRAFFNRSKSLRRLGQNIDAQEDEDMTLELFHQTIPNDSRKLEDLTDKDLERMVVFWSR